MKYLVPFLLLFPSCTYAITMVHTEGQASDVVDEAMTPTATVTATAPAL
jgi:hypothetical protein